MLFALGIANVASAMFGTMGGGANFPMSQLALGSGANGKYRINGLVASLTMLVFILVASDFIQLIPTSSLVGIMFSIVFDTFVWESLLFVVAGLCPAKLLAKVPALQGKAVSRMDAIVIVVVTIVTLTNNLFESVVVGVCISACAAAWGTGEAMKVLRTEEEANTEEGEQTKVYHISGPLLFSSCTRFVGCFDFDNDPNTVAVVLHCQGAMIPDFSGFNTLCEVSKRYSQRDKTFIVRGLDDVSLSFLAQLDKVCVGFKVGLNGDIYDVCDVRKHCYNIGNGKASEVVPQSETNKEN
jgi:SulP family sulfate permease